MAMAKPWNPMEDAYKNKDFNKYQQGPGADLDDDLQPGAVASGGMIKKKFRLCLKNVPKEMTPKAVTNLCSNYGKVVDVHNPTTTPYVFVCFATLNDMERALTGLKDNSHGITAELARDRQDNQNPRPTNFSKNKDENENPSNQNQVDMSKRNIKGPFSNPPRPGSMTKKPLVTHNDYETSNLKNVDPQKHFLIQNDMHDNDRNNYRRKSDNVNGPGGRRTHTGRSYHVDSQETMDQIKQLSESSRGGSFDSKSNSYVKNSSNLNLNEPNIGKCILCSKDSNRVCQRCGDFYCSFDCQKKDWSKHRYICFQMPNLITPNSHIGVELPEKAPNLTSTPQGNKQAPNDRNFSSNMSQQQQQQQSTNTDKFSGANRQRQYNGPSNSSSTETKRTFSNEGNQKQQPNNEQKSSFISKKFDGPKPPIPASEIKSPATETKAVKPERKNAAIISAELPKSGSTVAMTAFIKSNFVYTRSLAPEDNLEYVKLLNIVNNESKKAKFIDKLPDRGALVMTEFQGTGYYRALVVNVENADKITVMYIDFGNADIKKMSELKELTPEGFNLKRYTFPVILKGVPDFPPSEKIMEYFNSFLDTTGKDLKLTYEKNDEGKIEGELTDISTNENINKRIIELNDVKVPKDTEAPVMNTDIVFKLLPDGEKVPVYCFDNSLILTGYISCIHESDVMALEAFNQQLVDYAEKTKDPYTPREGEMCLVKYEEDGVWYRAECIEVVGDGNPSVLFIDYGNLTTSHIDNIRKYPKEFTHPCLTSSCLIKDIPENLDAKAAERIKELIPINSKIVIDKVVCVKEEDFNIIYMPNIIETLKSEKLI